MTVSVNDSYIWRCVSLKILVLWQQGKCLFSHNSTEKKLFHEFSIPVLFHLHYVYSCSERRKCFVFPIFFRRMEQFQVSRWRRMKTPEEGTGATKLSLCSPAWAMLWAWVTFGGFPTSATEMEEVHTRFQRIFSDTYMRTHWVWTGSLQPTSSSDLVTSHLPDDAAIVGHIMALAGCMELQSKPLFLNHAKFCVTVLLLAGVWMPSYKLWVLRMRPAAASPDVWLWAAVVWEHIWTICHLCWCQQTFFSLCSM